MRLIAFNLTVPEDYFGSRSDTLLADLRDRFEDVTRSHASIYGRDLDGIPMATDGARVTIFAPNDDALFFRAGRRHAAAIRQAFHEAYKGSKATGLLVHPDGSAERLEARS